MTSLRPWLMPTLLGPLLVMWGVATLGAFAIGAAALTHGTVDDWAVLMMWSTFFGCTMGVFLVLSDVFLLASKTRQLPTGGRAWLSSMLVPFLCYGLWMVLPPPSTALFLMLWMFGPMGAAAFASRMLFGSRP
ncbi:MAG: hypothetical protein H6719_27270 [Sandaracinaceae bacterium]|nr:hypothetical protein [Sandaracinaceae bacterium]